MKSKIEIIPNPLTKEYTILGSNRAKEFANNLLTEKYVLVDVGNNTKTSFRISIQFGSDRYGINYEVKGLKYLTKREVNYFAGDVYTGFYLKAKNLTDLKAHLDGVLAEVFPQIEEITYKVYETEVVKQLKQNSPESV